MHLTHKPGSAGHIVVLDDSKVVLAAVREALTRAGYQVHTAQDPSELVASELREVSAMVVDVQMTQVFGDDVVRFLRGRWNLSVPILLFSSLSIEELESRASAAGADGAVSKQQGVEALVTRIGAMLGAS